MEALQHIAGIQAIVSPDRPGRSEREEGRYKQAFLDLLRDSHVKYTLSLGGCRAARNSCSAILSGHGAAELALRLGKDFQQESVLIVQPSGRAFMIYLDGQTPGEYIGEFQAVTKEQAEQLDGWTLNLEEGQYYAVLPERK